MSATVEIGRTVEAKPETVRAIWRTDIGQRVEQWLPPGRYTTAGTETINDVRAIVLLNCDGYRYFVHPNMADKLSPVAVKRKTFGDLPFRVAEFRAPAVNGGPFNNAPALSDILAPGDDVERRRLIDTGEAGTDTSGKHLATPVEFCGDGRRFFLCYAEDCYSPPFFIVRTDDESEAINLLLENHEPTFRMSDEDVAERDADGIPETVGYTSSGVPYDSETIRVREVELTAVRFA